MLALFFIVVIDLIGFGIIIPLLPFYAEFFQASPFVVGLLMASYSLGQFISAPFWGGLSDRIGRRPVLLATLGGTIICYLWLGLSTDLVMLFAARLVGGIMAGNISTAFAYIADVTTPENRTKGMGIIGAAFGLGFIIGPAIGGILAGDNPQTADFQTPAFAACGLSLMAFCLTFLTLKESLPQEIRDKLASRPKQNRLSAFIKSVQQPVIGVSILLIFLTTFAFAGLEATFAIWSERRFGWGPEQNGYLFAFIGVLSAIIQGGLIGKLSKRFGNTWLIIQGGVALAIGIGLIPFSGSIPVLIIAMAIATYGFSTVSPALNSLISLQTDETAQGHIMGVTRSATTMARIAGPTWAGFLFSFFGMNWPYYCGAFLMIIVTMITIKTLLGTSTRKQIIK